MGAILWMLVGESIVEMLAPGVSKFLPAHASTSVLGIVPADMSVVAPAVGAALLGGWAVLSLGSGDPLARPARHRVTAVVSLIPLARRYAPGERTPTSSRWASRSAGSW